MHNRPSLTVCFVLFFFQAEDGIRDLVRSRGLGDVYKRQSVGGGGVRRLRDGPGQPADPAIDPHVGTAAGFLLSLIHI